MRFMEQSSACSPTVKETEKVEKMVREQHFPHRGQSANRARSRCVATLPKDAAPRGSLSLASFRVNYTASYVDYEARRAFETGQVRVCCAPTEARRRNTSRVTDAALQKNKHLPGGSVTK